MSARRPAPPGYRTCQDCAGLYQRGPDTDTRWCPECVAGHVGRCAQCHGPFDRDGVNRLCPCCRDQAALFVLEGSR